MGGRCQREEYDSDGGHAQVPKRVPRPEGEEDTAQEVDVALDDELAMA